MTDWGERALFLHSTVVHHFAFLFAFFRHFKEALRTSEERICRPNGIVDKKGVIEWWTLVSQWDMRRSVYQINVRIRMSLVWSHFWTRSTTRRAMTKEQMAPRIRPHHPMLCSNCKANRTPSRNRVCSGCPSGLRFDKRIVLWLSPFSHRTKLPAPRHCTTTHRTDDCRDDANLLAIMTGLLYILVWGSYPSQLSHE